MARGYNGMRPQDILVLLRILFWDDPNPWRQKDLADDLGISQSEVTFALERSRAAGLLDQSKRQVFHRNLLEFLLHGLKYVYPVAPGPLVRGVPTAHSAPVLSVLLSAKPEVEHQYVWPHEAGSLRGQAIEPLCPAAIHVSLHNESMHSALALIDAVRMGSPRVRKLAAQELAFRIVGDRDGDPSQSRSP